MAKGRVEVLLVWRTIILGLCLGCCGFLLTACESTSVKGSSAQLLEAEKNSFVSVDGSQFMLAGHPYFFAGVNFWYGAYLGASEQGQARLIKELDQLDQLGIRNLRVLAGSEASNLVMSVSPAIMKQPGMYNEQLLVGLDFLLHEMGKRNMKAVLYFTNFWQWSGGMAQLVAWDKGEEPLDPDVTNDWNGFMQYSAQLYKSKRAMGWLNDFIEHLITRKNTVNGKWYKDDTAIMSWELANEPRPGSDPGGHEQYPEFKAWVANTADFIKSLDANHLVTTGNEGSMGTSRNMEWFVESHQPASIDYLTFHLWPKNWGWYDVTNPDVTFSSALAQTKTYILQHIAVAKTLNKPIVLEEFGLERNSGAFDRAASTSYRDDFLKEVFALVEQQAKIGAPIAGTNVWAWGGLGQAQNADFIWAPGDPYTGDPPQEPQGLNSIFSEDSSTLEVLKVHASTLNAMR